MKQFNIHIYVLFFVLGIFHFPAQGKKLRSTDKIKNVILFIGDGMGLQQISLLQAYASKAPKSIYKGKPSTIHKMLNQGELNLMITAPAGALVPDSASSATHMAIGKISRSEAIGQDQFGENAQTVLELAKSRGMKTGLVSDTRITHATPAAFAAHVTHRREENTIAEHVLATAPDVLLSGGYRYFLPQSILEDPALKAKYAPRIPAHAKLKSKRLDNRDLLSEFEDQNFTVALNKNEMLAASGDKLLGLFAPSGMPDELWYKRQDQQNCDVPHLSEMTTKALEVLNHENDQGFFLMVESGQIDWAAHSNDTGQMLNQLVAMDQTIKIIKDYVDGRDDTILIVTADHETGSFGLSYSSHEIFEPSDTGDGYRPNYNFGRAEVLDGLYASPYSFYTIIKDFKKLPKDDQTPGNFRDYFNERSDFPITLGDAIRVWSSMENKAFDPTHDSLNTETVPAISEFSPFYVYGEGDRTAILARVLSAQHQVVWGTGTHTAAPVLSLVYGPSEEIQVEVAEGFRGLKHNSMIGKVIGNIIKK